MSYLIILTFVLLAGAAFFLQRTKCSRSNILWYILLNLIVLLLNIFYLVSNYFTGEGINEAVIYHIRYGLTGSGFNEYVEAGTAALLITIIVLFVMGVAISRSRKRMNRSKRDARISRYLLVAALLCSPAFHEVVSIYASEIQFDMQVYQGGFSEPVIEKVGPPKNIVYVYGESLEETWSDPVIFPGLTSGLDRLKQKSLYFTNIKQTKRDSFTIAGVVASQCGLSITSTSYRKVINGSGGYLKDAVCLGDILENQGYHVAYYGGSSLDFAGKDLFLKDHGFAEVVGPNELKSKLHDSAYVNSWGVFDDTLFAAAFERFNQLSAGDKKFALVVPTMTTHPPHGILSTYCKGMKYESGSDPMLNAVYCSDKQVTDFIEKILRSPYAKDTVIVFGSDHLAFENSAIERLKKSKNRTNRLMIFSPDVIASTSLSVSGLTRDITPIILPFIGFKGLVGLSEDIMKGIHVSEYRVSK